MSLETTLEKMQVLLSECDDIDLQFNFAPHLNVKLKGATRAYIFGLLNSPNTAEDSQKSVQQTQPIIPLPEECVFVPMADKLGIDINLAAKLYDAVVAKQQAGA